MHRHGDWVTIAFFREGVIEGGGPEELQQCGGCTLTRFVDAAVRPGKHRHVHVEVRKGST